MQYDKVTQTGRDMRVFTTGSVRDSSKGKGRPDLIPPYPLKRLAMHYENGAQKYGDRNWEKGQPVNQFYASAFRHMLDWMSGNNSEDHLSAVIWNVMGMIHTIEEVQKGNLPYELIADLPEYIVKRLSAEARMRGDSTGSTIKAE